MNKKRVLVDVTVLTQAVKTGIYRMTDEIVQYLMAEKSLEIFFTLSEENFSEQHIVGLRADLQKYCNESNIVAPFIDANADPAFANIDIYIAIFFKIPDIWQKED